MNKKYLTYENKILGQEVERLAKEVERLEKVNQMLLNSMVTEAHTKETKEIERLNNIIKEVREYIENNKQYAELECEIEKRDNTLSKIKSIIDNEKITGIEAKLMIKDILEGIE